MLRKIYGILILVILAAALLFSVTLAWTSFSQGGLNELRDEVPVEYDVELIKLQKNADGTKTALPVQWAEFYLYNSDGVQVKTRFVTDGDGKIQTKLPAGAYYFEETAPGHGFVYDKDPDGKDITRYPFEVKEDEPKTVVVEAFNIRDDGSLTIRKVVQNSDGTELTDEQRALLFEFTVVFSDGGTYAYQIDGTGAETPLTSGQTLSLSHEQQAVFKKIPIGVQYLVVETPAPGYNIESFNHTGNIILDGCYAEFTNTKGDPEEGKLIIEKLSSGEGFDMDKKFIFTVYINGAPLPDKIELKAGEKSEEIPLPMGASYYVVEQDEFSNQYILYPASYGMGTAKSGVITSQFSNRYIGRAMIEISGEKTWGDKPADVDIPRKISVRLKGNGIVIDEGEVVADKDGKWRYQYSGPKYDADGEIIAYEIEELATESWRPTYEGYNITNHYVPPIITDSIVIEKVISGNTPSSTGSFGFVMTAQGGAPMPEGSSNDGKKTVYVKGGGFESFGNITYTKAGTYSYTIAEIDDGQAGYTYDKSVYTYTVIVEEKALALSVSSRLLVKDGKNADKCLFTNNYSSNITKISVKKVWIDDGTHPKSVFVQLYKDDAPYGDPIVLEEQNNWSHAWDNMDKHFDWRVDELDVPEGYEKRISGDLTNGFLITNTKAKEGSVDTSIRVKKAWVDNGENRPESVTVQLYKDGTAYGAPIYLNQSNDWRYAWENLDRSAAWTVDEIDVPPGYTKKISGEPESGYTITNTWGVPPAGKVHISGTKTWYHGQNDPKNQPKSITVILRANGNIVSQKKISKSNNWYWSFYMNQYDADGGEIVYTIDEADIPNYTKEVDGYSLTNSYYPPPPSSNAKTGDDSNILIWIFLLCFSSVILIVLIRFFRRKSRKS